MIHLSQDGDLISQYERTRKRTGRPNRRVVTQLLDLLYPLVVAILCVAAASWYLQVPAGKLLDISAERIVSRFL